MAGAVKLLQLAAESWDAAQQARAAVAEHGQFYTDRYGCPHPHPAVAIARDARLGYARLLRELGLDVAEPADAPRPPLRANSRRVKQWQPLN